MNHLLFRIKKYIFLEKDDLITICLTMKFMHPKGPSKFYYWPQREDLCFIPNHCVLKIINVSTAMGSGRKYSINNNDEDQIKLKWDQFLEANLT